MSKVAEVTALEKYSHQEMIGHLERSKRGPDPVLYQYPIQPPQEIRRRGRNLTRMHLSPSKGSPLVAPCLAKHHILA